MKPYLFLLLCCFNFSLFAQKLLDPTHQQDFTIKNIKISSAGITLAGTIFKPSHPNAALVLVHGSGQEKRMAEMASFLAKNGIAVLTYDKRGVGESGGVYAGPEAGTNNIDPANLDLLASDASAAITALLANLPGKHVTVGLMGFSQAGWVIPIAAKKNNKVSFMVIFSGPIVSTLEQLRFQFYTKGNAKFWDTHTEAEAREHVNNDPDRYEFAATNPRDALTMLSIKGLWLFGGRDIQIPVGLSIEQLEALKVQGKSYEYQLFPAFGHNTAFAKSQEPVDAAILWIKSIDKRKKRK